jgi:hypothetical protein
MHHKIEPVHEAAKAFERLRDIRVVLAQRFSSDFQGLFVEGLGFRQAPL